MHRPTNFARVREKRRRSQHASFATAGSPSLPARLIVSKRRSGSARVSIASAGRDFSRVASRWRSRSRWLVSIDHGGRSCPEQWPEVLAFSRFARARAASSETTMAGGVADSIATEAFKTEASRAASTGWPLASSRWRTTAAHCSPAEKRGRRGSNSAQYSSSVGAFRRSGAC